MPEDKSKPWFGRNWKWILPSGCFVLILVAVGIIALIFTAVTGMIKSSGAYTGAMDRARASGAVIQELGEPIEPGWYLLGSINVNGSSGDADLTIPLSGPHGKATLYVVAHKRAGEWEYETLQVKLEDGDQRIDLLPNPQ